MAGLTGSAVCIVGALGTLLSIQNAGFQDEYAGKPAWWRTAGKVQYSSTAGPNNTPAVILTCSGWGDSSYVRQNIRPTSTLTGSVRVSALMKCEEVDDGGDCAVWLDTLRENDEPLWHRTGQPDRGKRGWQRVSAIVSSDTPIKEIQIFLILRNVKGRVLFADVQLDNAPLEITQMQVDKTDDSTYEIDVALSEPAPWTIEFKDGNKVVHSMSGEDRYFSETYTAEPGVKITSALLTSTLKGITVQKSVKARSHSYKGPMVCWTADSTERIFQNDPPPARAGTKVTLNSGRNDRESFQICLKPLNKPLKNVRVKCSDLKGGKASISTDNLEWFRVGYVWVKLPSNHPLSARKGSAWWPDPLLPALPSFDVERAQTQPIWVTVHTPPDTPVGTYKGRITISADDVDPVEISVRLNVYPATIPNQGSMKTAFALMDCYLRKIYGTITPELRRNYTDYLLAHHINPDDITRSDLPDVDELVYANENGLNTFNILHAAEPSADPHSWVWYSPLEAYTPEFTEQFLEKIRPTVEKLEEHGLIDKAYIYGFDERGPEYMTAIRELFGAIKKRYPRVHTLSTAWLPEKTNPMDYNIDWYVPLSSKYDPDIAQKVRSQGGEIWWYICMGPGFPYANWLLENPLVESRVIWWSAYQNDVEGFLYWGTNIWIRENNFGPIPDDAGPRLDWSVTTGGRYATLNGDGVLLYPGVKGPIGSIRMEVIRDGLEDFELLRMYEERAGKKKLERVLSKVSQGTTKYTRDKKVLDSSRLTMLKAVK